MHRKTILGAVIAASLMGIGAAAQAQLVVNIAPPAPRHEVVPAARAGYVWAPGHYEYRGNNYTWVGGQWYTARNGYEYREPRWVQRGNGEWYMAGGNWERGAYGDRDHDGVPNRFDRDSRDHRGGRPADRDGDGVPDRFDNYPNNPRRS
jgi:hypothetical protein